MPFEPPTVIARIQTALRDRANGLRVAEARIGLAYTGVLLSDGSAGVAMTLPQAHHCCEPESQDAFDGQVPLAGRSAAELIGWLPTSDPIRAALGLACVNALANRANLPSDPGDILQQLPLNDTDRVGMVGHFRPLVGRLRERVAELLIFERLPTREPGVLDATEAFAHLPDCQVALLTATSILNNTIDALLAACRSCRAVAVLGASTPLLPEVFAETPVSLLSGVLLPDPASVLRIISEAGGMRVFKRFVDKVNLPVAKGSHPV